jgi:hypothetical protein
LVGEDGAMKITKEQAMEFARAYVNYKGSDSLIDKKIAKGFVENLGQRMDAIYNNQKPELQDNQAKKLRR